jgi:hypothetical protein
MSDETLSALPSWAAKFFPDPGRGLVENLPEEVYHGTRSLMSKSALDIVARSLLHYRYWLDEQPDDDETASMKLGHAFHVATLEPDLFAQKVLELPDFGPLQSSKNRATRDDWIAAQTPGVTILKATEIAKAWAMGSAVRAHPGARLLLRKGRPEVTATWTDAPTGIRCKARADWLPEGFADVGCDLKSAIDASPEGFARAAARLRYHVQDAFYTEGFRANDVDMAHFAFIVCESTPPYAVAVYELDDTARVRGEQLYMRELRAVAAAIQTGKWTGYGDEVMNLRLPTWATPDEVDVE